MPRVGQKIIPPTRSWNKFKQKWANCSACKLCETRDKIVLARGHIPCEILFVGEAPGVSEDTIGQPFIGPAGKLLDQLIREAGGESHRICFTNLICCIPIGEDGKKTIDPPKWAIQACTERLNEFVQVANPTMIVRVGKVAQSIIRGWDQFGEPENRGPMPGITHPSAILQASPEQKPYLYQQAQVILENAFAELVPF